MDYMGHFISNGKLSTDLDKISTTVAWPTIHDQKKLRDFLGLTCYYRQFITRYAMIAAPLNDLLKKKAFV